MKVVIFDTETNGLPKNRYAPPSQTDAFPAVIQLSWAVYNITGTTMTAGPKQDVTLGLAPEIAWDTGAAAIHGIKEEVARRGVDPATALLAFREVLQNVDCIICHNMAFDRPVIRASAYAASSTAGLTLQESAALRNFWPSSKIQEFCTMEQTRTLVGVPSAPEARHPFKAPRLNELYTWLHGHVYDLSGSGNVLHTARSDTHCLARCVLSLLRKGHVIVKDKRLFTTI